MAQVPEENVEKLFEDAFALAASDAEKGEVTKVPEKTADELAAEQKTADDAAAAQKVADDAAAAQKVTDDAAAALAEANKGKTADQLAAEQKIVDDKTAADKVAADAKTASDAAAKVEADRKAAEPPAKVEETADQKAAREQFEASIKPYEPTAEEVTALAKFKEDFPNEAAAVEARLKSVDRDINARVYQAVQAVLAHVNGRLTPVETGTAAITRQTHLDTLHRAHADYDTVVTKIPDWIKTQPKLLQPTLQAAYDEGDTQSVLDLVTMYKGATGTVTAGKTAAQIAAEQTALDVAAAKKKKADDEAAALAPVGSKRTTTSPRGARDPNDFDGAFEEAAAAAAGGK